ncbi:hypothetical protein [Roseinatronobacter sp. S2]|uniref:hypothetical protein n=1 Tax=Roseinatronobacter sp. S2 TaxID=3035471 RepID=UPI0024106E10|nr:hypothetical protein [Roseinatronobacter sp. S2]WFE75207.1 hypothetical protein P8S53_02020 [Roseinatronobacter sp. S2]
MPRPLIFVLVVALCGALDIALHMAGGDLIPMPSAFSPLVDRFGFSTVAAIWIALAFTSMGLLFLAWAWRMAGTGRQKGLRYGLALGLMIFVAMFEGVGLLGTPLTSELIMGLADAIPIALLIALFGWTLAKDSPDAPAHLPAWPVLIAFALVYGLARTGVQMLGLIESGLEERPLPSLIWPFAMGAAIGVLFLAMTDALRGLSRASGALAFGFGMFGANWALFMAFVPMVFPDALLDTAMRVGLDILLVTCAALMVGLKRYQGAG